MDFSAPQIKCKCDFKIIISTKPFWSRIDTTYLGPERIGAYE